MVDLNTYRSRIGSFLSRHFSYMRDGSRYRNRSRSHENTCYSMDMKCLFLLVVGLTFLRIHFDPAVEWNPGPRNRKQSMVYRSASEKKLFNELRSIDSSIARCASHRFFLGNCHRHGIVPKGFNPKSVLCSFMPNDSLTYELACISTRSDLQKMDAIIDHLNATLIDLYEQRSRKQTELANHGTDKIRGQVET